MFAFCHCWNLLRNQGLSNKMIPPHFRQTLQKTKVAKVYHSPNEIRNVVFVVVFLFQLSGSWQQVTRFVLCPKKAG